MDDSVLLFFNQTLIEKFRPVSFGLTFKYSFTIAARVSYKSARMFLILKLIFRALRTKANSYLTPSSATAFLNGLYATPPPV